MNLPSDRCGDESAECLAKFTTVELEAKLAELRKLAHSGILTDRSLEHQFTEIAIIENELTTRDGG